MYVFEILIISIVQRKKKKSLLSIRDVCVSCISWFKKNEANKIHRWEIKMKVSVDWCCIDRG